jgi:hypothetical protein
LKEQIDGIILTNECFEYNIVVDVMYKNIHDHVLDLDLGEENYAFELSNGGYS